MGGHANGVACNLQSEIYKLQFQRSAGEASPPGDRDMYWERAIAGDLRDAA